MLVLLELHILQPSRSWEKQISIKKQKENEAPVKTAFCLPNRGGAAVVVLLPSSTIMLFYLFIFARFGLFLL